MSGPAQNVRAIATRLKATHPAIKAYHAALKVFAEHGAEHEGATETAFSRLLSDTAKTRGWTLIPKKQLKVGGKTIYPDGTLQDENFLRRGYWEAKDTNDNLEVEIGKKRAKGYPLTNTIFEDTRRAVLYQNGTEVAVFDLASANQVVALLDQFYAFKEPDHDRFEEAVAEFKERVPELAAGLVGKIRDAHAKNKKFQETFEGFFALCRASLNPNISREAVDEMLVQHLLTERLFRKIFHDEEFTSRNVIAVEVEKVVAALVSKSFSRAEFLKSLDKFYKAIEGAAETIPEFQDKQHFLNTVYERFFQGYSVKVADTHGIVYTPQPIVDFMCASVEEVLKTEFNLSLGSKGVNLLDPCTGTGNFVVNLLHRVTGKDLERVYKEQLFANEVLLLPYYIASLNIEHAFFERTQSYEAFPGLCFVDTLELAEPAQRPLEYFAEENTERVQRQKRTPITVIIGNPPYNVGQLNENDNNKNRKYREVDTRIKRTYAKDSRATSVSKLNDPYVKFFRWATDRLKGRDGVICYVSNNSFVEQIAFDGMRKHLMQDFTRIYHLHLEGNVRQNPKLAGTAYNVFGIQVGVGITVAVKSGKHTDRKMYFHRLDKNMKRAKKLGWVASKGSLASVPWKELTPDANHNWLVPEHAGEFNGFIPVGSKQGKTAPDAKAGVVFKDYSLGVATHRDSVVYGFDRQALTERMKAFVKAYNAEVDRFRREGDNTRADNFDWSDQIIWDRDLKRDAVRGNDTTFVPERIRKALYRPFAPRWLYFDRLLNAEIYSMGSHYPKPKSELENRTIVLSDMGCRSSAPSALCASQVVDLHLCATLDGHQCFPFYVYESNGKNRRENITDWALKQFRSHYNDKQISKWDIFHYVYAVLHHPGYRTKFADNLKKSLPRIPFAPNFQAFATAGKELAELHVDYEQLGPYPLDYLETPDMPLSYVVDDKMKLSKDKTSLRVNASLTLTGIPPEVFEYRLGNRSALEWVIDQYQVTEDARTGIRSDPNRADEPEYIVSLVGQVVKVSLETVKIVNGLPKAYSGAPAGQRVEA